VPGPKPQRVAQIDDEWLTAVLANGASGARVAGTEDRGGTSGTTDRRRIKIVWNDAGIEAGLPDSVFVKATAPSAKNRTMVAGLWMAINEVKFYERIRPHLGDIAPRSYHAWAGHGARFMLLLEDLSDAGAVPISVAGGCSVEHARGVIDALAQLHAAYWQSPRLESDLSWAAPMTRRPGFALLANLFHRTRRKFLSQVDERNVGPHARRMLRLVNENDAQLYRTWSDGPQTLVHGDSHVGNTYALPDGRAGLLDWQVIFSTRGVREISYFVCGGLTPELRRTHERDLLQRYLDGLSNAGVADPPSFEQAWADYRFFAHDAFDSSAVTVLWSGLQAPEVVARGYAHASAAVEDLAVDEVVEQRIRDNCR
jgi:hypothetical protein